MTDAARPDTATRLQDLYRDVWRHARGARLQFLAALGLLGSSQALRLTTPWLAAQAINAIQTGGLGALRAAGVWIAAIVGVQVFGWALHGPARVMERSVGLRVRRSVADDLYVRLARAPLAWHERHHSGDVQHRVHQASTALGSFSQSQFVYLQNVINLVGPVLALTLLSRLTGLIAVVGFVATAVVILRFDLMLMHLAVRENQAERRYAARLLDFVGNVSAVASLRLQDATRRLLDTRLLAVFTPLRRTIVLNEWKWCSVDLLTLALTWGLVVLYATTRSPAAAGGTVLLGSLYMIHQYAQQASGVLAAMASNYQTLARTQADYASARPVREAPEPPVRQPALDPAWRTLALHGVSYAHAASGRDGVANVHLTLSRGERVALVGPSGSGKSTLLRVIAGLYEADRGHVEVDGIAVLGRREASDLSTLIPQEAEVFEATARENITLDVPTDDAAVRDAVHVGCFDDVVATLPLGLDTPLAERGANLSGGQRQRLALARGVLAARGHSLLLLDEPTSALDALTEQRVHERLEAAFQGATLVAAVHRLALLPRFDRVVFMDGGRVVDTGTVAYLAARQPTFARMLAGAGTGTGTGTGGEDDPVAA